MPEHQRHFPALAQQLLEHPAFAGVTHTHEIAPAELICGTTRVADVATTLAINEIKSRAYEEFGFTHWFWLLATATLILFLVSFNAQHPYRPNTGLGFCYKNCSLSTRVTRISLILFCSSCAFPRLPGVTGRRQLGPRRRRYAGSTAEPIGGTGVVGVSGTAALGATLTFYTGLASVAPLALPLGGITGALAAVVLLFMIAGKYANTATLLLAGIALNAIAGALTTLTLNLSPNPFAAMEIIFWQMGSLADRSILHLQLSAPLMLAGWALILHAAPAARGLSLGEVTASSLGINVRTTQRKIILGTALCVGAGVAVTGIIGFVGLVVPHLLRRACRNDPAQLMLASAVGGASLLLAADIAVRCIPTNAELKLGVVTALIGAPVFLYLIFKVRRLEQ